MTVEPGREAWLCPKCGFVVGFVDEDNNLAIYSYLKGFFVSIRCGTLICTCGHIIHWHAAATILHALDKDAAPMVQ